MKVSPVASPNDIRTPASPDLKAKAIAAFNKGQSSHDTPIDRNADQQSPVLNQNAVGVEELGAIIPKPNLAEAVVDQQADTSAAIEETPAPKPAEDPALSRQFAQLARQEKQLRLKAQQQNEAIKVREAALQAREQEIQAKDTQYKTGYTSLDRIKSDPLSVLAEAGVSYDDVVQQVLNTQAVDPRLQSHIQKLEAKIASLEEHNTNSQKSYGEQQQAQYQAAVKQIRMDATQLVKNDPNFETIKATNSIQDVVELITKTYDKDGILLSVEEAANEVENYLMEEALKITQISKIKARMAQASTPRPSVQQTQAQPKQPQMRTLTNATSSTRQLSARERAILAFKGESKT
jgi:hypothetical protein